VRRFVKIKLIEAGPERRPVNTCGFDCFDPSSSPTQKLILYHYFTSIDRRTRCDSCHFTGL